MFNIYYKTFDDIYFYNRLYWYTFLIDTVKFCYFKLNIFQTHDTNFAYKINFESTDENRLWLKVQYYLLV